MAKKATKVTTTTRAQMQAHNGPLGPHKVGDTVVIRAIPFHYIGEIEILGASTVTLKAGAVWLADSSRWGDCLRTGRVNEAEPYPTPVTIGYAVIADVTLWRHSIPGQV